MIIVGIAVFYCIFHAYYHKYKNAPKEKRPRKILTYLIVLIAGISLVFVGQHYFKDSEYVQNLWNSWEQFETGNYQDTNYEINESQPFNKK